MKHSFYHISDINSDRIGFQRHLQGGRDNSSEIYKMKKILSLAIINELTVRQRFCIEEYYLGGKKMKEIAEELGVAPSTVTRHIQSGKQKLKNIANYYM